MLEPAVTLTDFALFVLNAWLAIRIARALESSELTSYWVFFFATIAAGALAGAISHGWFPEATHFGHVLWRLTMLLVGLAGVGSFLLASQLVLGERGRSALLIVAAVAWLGYTYVILAVRSDFKVAIMFYGPGAALLLLAFLATLPKFPSIGALGALGMLLTFVAACVQSSGRAIHPKYFDHNATYHLIQAVGLVLVYIAGKLWLQSAGAELVRRGG